MNVSELYKAGALREAIEAQVREVKSTPIDPSKRLFLFELLAFAGDLERARRQIEAVSYRDADLDAAVAVYGKLLDAELARRDVFARGVPPGFFGEPAEHLRLRLEAVNRLREGQATEAAEALGRANEATPAVVGRLNGEPFQSFRDADDLFAGVLEVMAHGRYFWVGLEQVRLVTINPPRFPRDLLFVPAHLELEEEQGDIFIPALYPGSHEHPDDQVKLGRMTDWKELDGGAMLGVGLHTFLRDDDAIGVLEWREWRSDHESAG
jgi:type VI secretion system protein ImpE